MAPLLDTEAPHLPVCQSDWPPRAEFQRTKDDKFPILPGTSRANGESRMSWVGTLNRPASSRLRIRSGPPAREEPSASKPSHFLHAAKAEQRDAPTHCQRGHAFELIHDHAPKSHFEPVYAAQLRPPLIETYAAKIITFQTRLFEPLDVMPVKQSIRPRQTSHLSGTFLTQ